MPNFNGAREWIENIDANPVDKSRLKSWVDKMEGAYRDVENARRDVTGKLDVTERLLAEAECEAERVKTLEQAIEDHRLGLLDTRELHDLLRAVH